MAILIDKETNHGATAKYWRVGVLNYHPRSKSCQIILDGFVNKAAANAGKEPLATREITLSFEKITDGNIKDVYKEIKLLDDWKAGTDD